MYETLHEIQVGCPINQKLTIFLPGSDWGDPEPGQSNVVNFFATYF